MRTCFVEAAANLRVAEKLASQQFFEGEERVIAVVNIAKVWTELGVALDNASGFDQRFPIPIRLVGDEDPQWIPARGVVMQEHVWPSMGPVVCTKCGFGPENVGPVCMGPLVTPTRMEAPQWIEPAPSGSEQRCPAHGNVACKRCARNGQPCLDSPANGCGFYSETGMHWDTCPQRDRSPLHVHSRPLCDHTWVRPMEPCANGCGKRPVPGQPGNDDFPWELCPKTCPDVTA